MAGFGASARRRDRHVDNRPPKKPKASVAKTFPAAGPMLTDSDPVRVAPKPKAHVIRVMHQFRSDYRPQVMIAVRATTDTDGESLPVQQASVPRLVPRRLRRGTSEPQLLGMAVSHGCVRVSNRTALTLKAHAPLGTPIWIKK